MSAAFLRVPVRLQNWQESLRRCANAINWLLERYTNKGSLYGVNLTAVALPTTSPGFLLAPWTNSLNTENAVADPVAGTITINETGLYTVQANIAVTNGVQNRSYVLELDVNGTQTPIVAYWWASAQQTILSLVGFAQTVLNIGDVVSLRLFVQGGAATVDIPGGQFIVEQVT